VYTLTIRYPDRTLKTEIKEGQTLLSALQSAGVHELDAPCGGNGKCGKCLARVSGAVTPPGDAEKKKNPNYDSVRLACQTKAVGDCEVYLEERSASVATHGNACDFPVDSWSEGNYGIAVDIGTTTVAAFLCELWTGNKVFIESGLNDQRSFGADVISRSSFAMETDGGLEKERAAIVSQLNGFARKLCARAGIPVESVVRWSMVGNTIMQHIFCGLSPATIAVAPFRPLDLFGDFRSAASLGLIGSDTADVYIAPAVAGYVGGDITAGLLSKGVCTDRNPYLFLDIGTNGEIVLFDGERSYCAACAAGPAFEGAQIECGSGSIPGAICKVKYEDGNITVSTLNDAEPASICGAGLLDLLSIMLDLGVVDETGRFTDEDECSPEALPYLDGSRFYPIPGGKVYVSDRDVREIQLAKAAVAAGVKVLLQEAGMSVEQVQTLYLAGGFGSNLNSDSAMHIGLIPRELKGRVVTLGNAAGAGACACLISQTAREMLSDLEFSYIELSVAPLFTGAFMEEMIFETGEN
jgi:uncharacterized 2Fe-2S/4Fe-4S cluster protein (DUF4445 family)